MQVSQREMSQELWDELYGKLVSVFVHCRGEELMKSILEDVLTDVELTVVVKRMAIALRLHEGEGYTQICEELKVSPPTVAKVKQRMKFKGDGYRYMIGRLSPAENLKNKVAK